MVEILEKTKVDAKELIKILNEWANLSRDYKEGIELLDLWTRGRSLREAHEELLGMSLEEAYELLRRLINSSFLQSQSSEKGLIGLAEVLLQIDILMTEG